MPVRDILLLGNPKLYEVSESVKREELDEFMNVVIDLHDTLMDFKERYGAGRAIAAPQIGVMKRIIYMFIEEPVVFINPEVTQKSSEMMVVWDDCMCFPELLVKVARHKTCKVTYHDIKWVEHQMWVKDDLSELLQHEHDHLDGVLAVSRATDPHAFALKSQRNLLSQNETT